MKSIGQLVLKLDMRWLFAAPAMPLPAISASVPHAACNATASASRHAAVTSQGSGRAWSQPRVLTAMTNAENSVFDRRGDRIASRLERRSERFDRRWAAGTKPPADVCSTA